MLDEHVSDSEEQPNSPKSQSDIFSSEYLFDALENVGDPSTGTGKGNLHSNQDADTDNLHSNQDGDAELEDDDAVLESSLVQNLKAENARLKDKLRFHAYGKDQKLKPTALCCITWHNISIEDRLAIEEILFKSKTLDEGKNPDLTNLTYPIIDDESYTGHGDLAKIHGFYGSVQYYKGGCTVDKTLGPVKLENIESTPKYLRNLSLSSSGVPKPITSSRPRGKCWNCNSEEHSVKDCRKPRDKDAINKNRLDFLEDKAFRMSDTRYWESEEDYKPGVLSPALREALGLGPETLPPWYPRMMIYGYPPGYFKSDGELEKGTGVSWMEGNSETTENLKIDPEIPKIVPENIKIDSENLKIDPENSQVEIDSIGSDMDVDVEDGEIAKVNEDNYGTNNSEIKPRICLVEYPSLDTMQLLSITNNRKKGGNQPVPTSMYLSPSPQNPRGYHGREHSSPTPQRSSGTAQHSPTENSGKSRRSPEKNFRKPSEEYHRGSYRRENHDRSPERYSRHSEKSRHHSSRRSSEDYRREDSPEKNFGKKRSGEFKKGENYGSRDYPIDLLHGAGEKNYGKKNTGGEKNYGKKNNGEKNCGDLKSSGEMKLDEKNSGEKNYGRKNSAEKNYGSKRKRAEQSEDTKQSNSVSEIISIENSEKKSPKIITPSSEKKIKLNPEQNLELSTFGLNIALNEESGPTAGSHDGGGPVGGGPVGGGPVGGGPVGGGPVSGGPVDGGPVSSGPVGGDPVSGGPVDAGSVGGGSVGGGSVGGGPVSDGPVGAGPDSAGSDGIRVDTAGKERPKWHPAALEESQRSNVWDKLRIVLDLHKKTKSRKDKG